MKLLSREDIQFDARLYSYSYFPQQVLLDPKEIPVTYYSLTFSGKDYNVTDQKNEVIRWLHHLGNGTKMGLLIERYIDWIWETDLRFNIKTFSSFNIHIMGQIPSLNIYSKRLMRHNHPPRQGHTKHNVATYVIPLSIELPVHQYFEYADYNDVGYTVPNQEDIFTKKTSFLEQCKTFADIYARNSDRFTGLQWKRKMLPAEWETLKINFEGSRYVHAVQELSTNIHLAAVFNDVDYVTPLNEEGIHFETIRNPDFL